MQMMRFCSSSLSFILKTLSNLTFDLVMIFIDIVHLVTIFNFNSPTIPCFFFILVADQYILFNDTGQVFLPPISFLQQQNICSFVIFFFKEKNDFGNVIIYMHFFLKS